MTQPLILRIKLTYMPGVLYKKEREVLEYLAQFQRQYGYSPTLGEIAKATGHRSNATIHAIIRSLVEKGYVQKVEGNARVLKIIDQKIASTMTGVSPSIDLPLMGYVELGKPLRQHEDANATIQISSSMISGKHTAFAMQVQGSGFVQEGLWDQDILIVEKTQDVGNNTVIIATIDGNAFVKKYTIHNGQVTLRALLNTEEMITPSTYAIIGKVAGVFRKYP